MANNSKFLVLVLFLTLTESFTGKAKKQNPYRILLWDMKNFIFVWMLNPLSMINTDSILIQMKCFGLRIYAK